MALDTPTGQQAADDAMQLACHRHWWQPWEQQGATTSPDAVPLSADPAANYEWRLQRSEDNKTGGPVEPPPELQNIEGT